MTKLQWETLRLNNLKQYKEEVIEFLYNKDNIRRCYECPYNEGFDPGPNGIVLKCGQYHCWVALHCKGV